MAGSISDDGRDSENNKYAPRRSREQARMPSPPQLYVSSLPAVPSLTDIDEDRVLPPERISERSRRRGNGALKLIGRVVGLGSFAALVALLTLIVRPLWQSAPNEGSSTSQAAKPSDRLTANKAPGNSTLVPATTIAAAPAAGPAASSQTQQAPLSPAQAQQASLSPNPNALGQEPRATFRGVTDSEIRFGISAPFSGAAKELGQNMKLGIEAAFRVANAKGGVHGRQLRLIAADDGYEPTRTALTMKQLYEGDQVFGVVGNVGTPTAAVGLPYALERKMLFFGAFTGAGLLRSDPPDRYVFNYRASYAEETEATVQYLVKVRRLKPTQIAVFAQQDAYGDSGFAGVARAIRSLGGRRQQNFAAQLPAQHRGCGRAVAQLQAHNSNKSRIPIRAVIMVPTYRAAAKFIEKTRDLYPDMIYTSVSFVGSTALANELMLLGKRFATGVIVTQVVPALDGHSSLVLDYKAALAKYFPGEAPDYVSLEGYVAANVLIEALNAMDLSSTPKN